MNKFSIEGETPVNILKHKLKIMRITILLLFTSILISQAATGYSQEIEFTFDLKSVSIKDISSEIEKNSNYRFIFAGNAKKSIHKKVDVTSNTETIEEVLDIILASTHLTYRIIDNQIVIYKDEEKNTTRDIEKIITELTIHQQSNIRGKVIDTENKEPLPGVTILIEGSTRGVTTDVDGTFEIRAEPSDKLIFSFIGMEDQIIEVEDQTFINIEMSEKVDMLDEVTVVAFGTQKKESVVSSISTVRPDELRVPSSNLTTAMAGRVAGMISYQRSGEPGQDDADFFIRGVTTFGYKVDPLILIDNVEVTSSELSRLQTDDIASFSIMKDAAATALYGARGANGVILVTTKQGAEGRARVSIRVENSISMPTSNVELADPITYMRLHNEAVLTRDPLAILPYTQAKIENTNAGLNPYVYPATDWLSELMEDYAMNQRYHLNISGGGSVARYYVSGSFSQDNGMLRVDGRNNFNNNINLKKYTLRSNINIDLSKSTELIVRMNGNFDDYVGPIRGGEEMYRLIMRTNPVLFPAYFPNELNPHVQHIMFGNYESGNYVNPYAEMVKGYKEYSRSLMLAQLELKQDLHFLTEGLSFRGLMNTNRTSYFDITRSYSPFYYSTGLYDRINDEFNLYLINENTGTEYLDFNQGPRNISSTFYLESALNYDRTFIEKHNVGAMLVYTMRQKLETGAGDLQLSLPYRNLGLSGRSTYSYADRYFVEFNFGYNGSERFHTSNRFGFFPSAGIAWSISNEPFWERYKNTINKLRLRATYGLAGNDEIGGPSDRFFYLSNVNMNAGGATFGRENGYSRSGVSVTRYANNDITWETAKKTNIALEVDLFDSFQIIAEYFHEYRSNILMNRSYIPSSMGLSASVRANVGEASGRGIDISVDYSKYFQNDFWLQGRGNFTYATNQYEVYEEPQYDEWWRSRVGYSIQQEWGFIAERLFVDEKEVANSPKQHFGEYMAGDIKYRDVNGDGQITEADMVPIGYPTIPEIAYGFGLSSGFKNLDISVFFQGVARESFRIGVSETAPFINNRQLLKVYADDHWSEDNRNIYAMWPRLTPVANLNNTQRSTWFLQDGSFLRLKQLEVGYSMQDLANKLKISNMRLYFSGSNLFLWSNFKLWDVEMAADGLGYPIQKVFNVGLNLTF